MRLVLIIIFLIHFWGLCDMDRTEVTGKNEEQRGMRSGNDLCWTRVSCMEVPQFQQCIQKCYYFYCIINVHIHYSSVLFRFNIFII